MIAICGTPGFLGTYFQKHWVKLQLLTNDGIFNPEVHHCRDPHQNVYPIKIRLLFQNAVWLSQYWCYIICSMYGVDFCFKKLKYNSSTSVNKNSCVTFTDIIGFIARLARLIFSFAENSVCHFSLQNHIVIRHNLSIVRRNLNK